MGMTIADNVIEHACSVLVNHTLHKLNEEQKDELAYKLVMLCDEFIPGNFTPVQENDIHDISGMD